MSKELIPVSFTNYTDDICEFVPNDYCYEKKCDSCPFYHMPGIAVTMIYRIKDVEDVNK